LHVAIKQRANALTGSALATAALWSYGLAAAGFLAFAVRLALGWRRNARGAVLIAAILATAIWAAACVGAGVWSGAGFWLASNVLDALRYACWFAFLGILLRGSSQTDASSPVSRVLPGWLIAIVATGLVASVVLSEGYPAAQVLGLRVRTGEFALRLGLAVFGLILTEQLLRRAPPNVRWSIKHLCVGLAGLFAFDLFLYADAMLYAQLDPDIWVARGIANVLVIPFVAISTARNTGWTIEMHMSRSAVFHSTALLLSGVLLLAVAAAGYGIRFFGGDWGRALQIELLFGATLLAVLAGTSGKFRSKLQVFVSKNFFSYRYDYRAEWLRFTRTLAAESSVPRVQERCIKALIDLVESPSGVLWLKSENDGFRPESRLNMAAIDAVEPSDGSLARFLERTGWVVNLDEYALDPMRYEGLDLPRWLAEVPAAWLVVPLISSAELVGFVLMTTPRTALDVNWEVLDLLKTASRQAASYLGQIRATEALLEARKFEAFNRMSAFVIHDLKNLVAQLSLMLKNSERHAGNPEFQRDMLSTVEHVVGRINGLMLQLHAGATPPENARLTDIGSIVQRICAAKSAAGARIDTDLTPGIFAVCNEDRMDHVIGHLIQNAIDATAEHGLVSVRVLRDGNSAVLEVVDTGIGMSADFMRDRLFRPFETTKADGMGIGVYESSRYVDGLGGQILIESTPGKGTCVRVLLPTGNHMNDASPMLKEVA
jgi:putative PEP-CTERM system histidine kinase